MIPSDAARERLATLHAAMREENDGPPVPATPETYGIAPLGFRLPATTRLGAVHLQVADLARSLEFYVDILGLRVLEREGARASLAAHGDDVPLIHLRELPGASPVPRRGRLGLYHYAILLPDRAALGRFYLRLHELGVRPGASDHRVSEAFYLHDPDGLGIEVYADRPRRQWLRRGRELVIVTEPLDLRALEHAAAGTRWSGMPRGTTIGHVHLHVGDLDEAAAFYHAGLGLDVVVWRYPGALFLSAGGYHHHLGTNTWAPQAAPAGPDDARLLAWTMRLALRSDVDAAARSLEQAGHHVDHRPGEWWAPDPWGTVLHVTSTQPAARGG